MRCMISSAYVYSAKLLSSIIPTNRAVLDRLEVREQQPPQVIPACTAWKLNTAYEHWQYHMGICEIHHL